MIFLLVAMAMAPSAAIIWYLYTKDVHDKEPPSLIIIAFFLGLLSVIPVLGIGELGGDFFGAEETDNLLVTLAYSFGVIALFEELAKFIFLRLIIFNKPAFNEPYDGIFYSVLISMGFATFENILYVIDGGIEVALLRMFTAVPAHAVFGVVMGYWLGLAKFNKKNKTKYIYFGLLMSILLHGAYDFFIIQNLYDGLGLISIVGLYVAVKWSISAIKIHSQNSPFNMDKYEE